MLFLSNANGRMTEMFRLLKELTTSTTPEKVMIREEAKSPVTKSVNSISLIREEEEKNDIYDVATGDDSKETDGPDIEFSACKVLSEINEKLIEGLVGNNSDPQEKDNEDIGGNFEIPYSIGGLKNVNALVDQGSDVNVMPYSTYMKLTDERPAETHISLSLASHSYIYPLGISEDVLVEIASGQKNNLDKEHTDQKENYSEDPFDIYKMLNKKEVIVENEKNSGHSLKYPPGFTPKEGTDATGMNVEESRNDHTVKLSDRIAEEVNNAFSGNGSNNNSKEDVSGSVCSGRFKKSEVPRTGGSLLSLMDELVKVGQVMGYKMEGCLAQKAKKDWVKELCVKHKVNFLALQETKMEHMELFSVKMCWGNLVFDLVHSDSVVWRITGKDLLIIAVYTPHDNKDKQMLWDYLTYEIGKWKWEVVIMGDFNEVRYKSDRFGSVFNVRGANVFNSFISSAGLEEVPLGGSTFTWCHKSATKMSKLDRFLISENLFNSCSNISAITLERYLSDHRPILLRESHFDYGPTPFRFFHYWIDMEGFSKVVEDAWREGPCDEANAMMNMMMKLKFLKTKIREWNKENMLNMKNVKAKHKEELEALEEIIDKGNGNEVVVNKRMEVVNTLQKIDKIHSFEMAQKAKVNWSIEGDENTSFFHGMLNKNRRHQNIWGIMIDGIWINNSIRVKDEFFQHFSSRFDKPNARRAHIEMRYPKTITCDQQADLERDVSNEEIKRAVWDCGTDKSPGPDGFSFGFYRRFWYLIENDVYDAVKYFFTYGVIPKGCNSSFIALIPKSPGANTVKDFRPISLIGSVYKIIAKILANRLVGVLGDIVNEVSICFYCG
ncbi:RNA-directed DNA polymerase, eukaryota [Tanacetum coccineum]